MIEAYVLDGARTLCIWKPKAALADAKDDYCPLSVIGGLGRADISIDMLLGTIRSLEASKDDPGEKRDPVVYGRLVYKEEGT